MRVRGVGGSFSVRGMRGGGEWEFKLEVEVVEGRTTSMGRMGGLVVMSMVEGRPSVAPQWMSHVTRLSQTLRRRWISHWFWRMASAVAEGGGRGSREERWRPSSWASRMAVPIACHCCFVR